MAYFGILTPIGESKQAAAILGGPTVAITHVAVGDGDGVEAEPTAGQPDLVNEVRRVGIIQALPDPNDSSRMIVEAGFAPEDGGYWVREASVIDADGDVIAVANIPSRFKPDPDSGSSNYLIIKFAFTVSSSSAFSELIVDATAVYASRDYADSAIDAAIAALPEEWTDSAKLGGELPGHYALASDVIALDTLVGENKTETDAALLAFRLPTGAEMGYWGASAPAGYVLASGRTIGSADSGATERANADTEALFTLLWESIANAELPIQTSAGAGSSRGASAAADFAANKRLPLPDLRGRTGFGLDTMGGSAASRLTSGASGVNGATLGAAGGAQTHTLTTAQIPVHSHGVTDPGHFHVTTVNTGVGGAGTARAGDGVFAATAQTTSNSTGITIQNAGSGDAHNNVPPAIVRNVIIKL